MAAVSLLKENPNPSEEEIRLGLEGNLCRCTGYHNIVAGGPGGGEGGARDPRRVRVRARRLGRRGDRAARAARTRS